MLHAEDEDIGGERVTLPNALCWGGGGGEGIETLTIEENEKIGSGDAGYDKVNPGRWEVKANESVSNKTPFQSVESLSKIKFYCRGAFFAFGGFHGVNDLLSNNDVVVGFSTRDKAGLEGVNEVSTMRFLLTKIFVMVL